MEAPTTAFGLHGKQARYPLGGSQLHRRRGLVLQNRSCTGRNSAWRVPLVGQMGQRSDKFTLMLGNSVRFIRPMTAPATWQPGDVNRTITLPAIKVSDLDKAVHAGAHNFELIANCSNTADVTFRFSGTPHREQRALRQRRHGQGRRIVACTHASMACPKNISINGERTLAVSGCVTGCRSVPLITKTVR